MDHFDQSLPKIAPIEEALGMIILVYSDVEIEHKTWMICPGNLPLLGFSCLQYRILSKISAMFPQLSQRR
ncbi:hypothetical protein [Cohaesibacter haloalkalitolerans]|uniref:hypothetical protein n=1 Tax=Cohaesibacter haloalkalitolerans TaxID=1162980 RepID=UPI0013C4318B|nr:hypothetical protein [Cohaesibacter haloalkalitolerans]